MRRKNQCGVFVSIGGGLSTPCLAECSGVCLYEKPYKEQRIYQAWCRYFGKDADCTSREARTEAATKLVKALRKKYGVK